MRGGQIVAESVYILMSNAGRVVAVYSGPPAIEARDRDYGKHLNKNLEAGTADWNCWVEVWPLDGSVESGVVAGKCGAPNSMKAGIDAGWTDRGGDDV